jgi:hypothetical protein
MVEHKVMPEDERKGGLFGSVQCHLPNPQKTDGSLPDHENSGLVPRRAHESCPALGFLHGLDPLGHLGLGLVLDCYR